jgi:hypothetical protein
MRKALANGVQPALGVVILCLVPLDARSGSVELTLNCKYESSFEITKGEEAEMSGSFSAIVQMKPINDTSLATIEATTLHCQSYRGEFSDQDVVGDCERTIADTKYKATLRINRINGAFEHDVTIGKQLPLIWSGHWTPAKKLF